MLKQEGAEGAEAPALTELCFLCDLLLNKSYKLQLARNSMRWNVG
jgi:hypothetical protein